MSSINLGSGVATASLGYHRDGSVQKLVWVATGHTSPIRSHTGIDYNVGGLRTQESVSVVHPATSIGKDIGGTARFSFDLADRLTPWTSPFRLNDDSATDQPKTTYELDDAGNITSEVVVADNGNGAKKKQTTSVYDNSRLESRTVETFDLLEGTESSTTNQEFFYTGLGEEKRRSATTTISGWTATEETATTYDALGHTNQIDNSKTIGGTAVDTEADLDYLYAADRQIVARTKKSATKSDQTLYFYWGTSTTLAEETTPKGTTRVRYLVSSDAQVIAEQSYDNDDLVTVEPDQANATFTFLLRDPDGNVATELEAAGSIAAQKAYDPYGARDPTGTSSKETDDEDDSTLGFQSDHTDDVTGNILLGPRVYDPTTDRFTKPDFYVASGPDIGLGTDPLTGNRYLFAGANPVAFYENGYEPCYARNCNKMYSGTKAQQRARATTSTFIKTLGLDPVAIRNWTPPPPAAPAGPDPVWGFLAEVSGWNDRRRQVRWRRLAGLPYCIDISTVKRRGPRFAPRTWVSTSRQ